MIQVLNRTEMVPLSESVVRMRKEAPPPPPRNQRPRSCSARQVSWRWPWNATGMKGERESRGNALCSVESLQSEFAGRLATQVRARGSSWSGRGNCGMGGGGGGGTHAHYRFRKSTGKKSYNNYCRIVRI